MMDKNIPGMVIIPPPEAHKDLPTWFMVWMIAFAVLTLIGGLAIIFATIDYASHIYANVDCAAVLGGG